GKSQYFAKQDQLFDGLKNEAVNSAQKALNKPRKYQKTDRQVVTINEGNHNSNSSMIEYAILIAIIEQISSALETSEIVLDVGIDGDLNSNKTLGAQKIVHKICADLKHKAKNVRAKIAKNNKWKYLESPIMKYYVQCVYVATARASDPNLPTPTEKDFALKNVFNLSEYQEYQKESIESFINGYNTLTILKTG
ncbi:4421_t:CDS:2, partial [Racocetra fulgida]